MSFRRIVDFATAAGDDGRNWTSFIHKTSSPVLGFAANWADGSVGAGIPRYNAYVGVQGEFTPMSGSGNFGLYTGPEPAIGQDKLIVDASLQCSTATMAPSYYMLCDYLGHYPLIDMDSTDLQALDNTASLPRYTSGAGVQMMAVCTVPQTASATATVVYTNSDGTASRTATFHVNAANIGTINCAANATAGAAQRTPFVPLADNDGGVRSVQSVTLNASAGGFISLVLVKPLMQQIMREVSIVTEKTPYIHDARAPRVLPGACLNHIFTSGGSAVSSVVRGHVTFAWG
jgi:hypothetical protein